MAKQKKDTVYWIEFSELNGRDIRTFIAKEMEVLDNGFVRAIGSFKRRKNVVTLLIPTTSISCIEEAQIEAEPEDAKSSKSEEEV